MTIHEFGQNHDEVVLLVHPSAVMWDYFEYVIPLMQDRYHLIVPALPGYDENEKSDFTSVEQIASELNKWLKSAVLLKYMPFMDALWAGRSPLWSRWGI